MNQCSQCCSSAMRVTGGWKFNWLTAGPPGRSLTPWAAALTHTPALSAIPVTPALNADSFCRIETSAPGPIVFVLLTFPPRI